MKIKFTERNEVFLHCRFCKATCRTINCYETSPVKGIVCSDCKQHLESYVEVKR